MIESKLKAKNCNRGQLFRPYWVSSARRSKLYEVFSWVMVDLVGIWISVNQLNTSYSLLRRADETQ